MPQTRFVTKKAFENDLNPILMVNKVDREGARPDWVVDEVFELFDQLGATEDQLDFPVVVGSAIQGVAGPSADELGDDLSHLLDLIVNHVPAPKVVTGGALQMQISALDYNSYVGLIGLGRISRGEVKRGQAVAVVDAKGQTKKAKILQVMGFEGLSRVEVPVASAGDIVCICGIDGLKISDTVCDVDQPEALPPLVVDEPTISMTFQVNTSPFAGRDGKFVTSRNLKDRLDLELQYNVALRVEPGDSACLLYTSPSPRD